MARRRRVHVSIEVDEDLLAGLSHHFGEEATEATVRTWARMLITSASQDLEADLAAQGESPNDSKGDH